jgi:hypothetical protein
MKPIEISLMLMEQKPEKHVVKKKRYKPNKHADYLKKNPAYLLMFFSLIIHKPEAMKIF